MDPGCHVNHLWLSDFHQGPIRWPCFNHQFSLLDAYVDRSRVSIFVWISQINGGHLNSQWLLGFNCFVQGSCRLDGRDLSFLSRCPILDLISRQPPNLLAITPEVTSAGHFQTPPCPLQCRTKTFFLASVLGHACRQGLLHPKSGFYSSRGKGCLQRLVAACHQICWSDLLLSQIFVNKP